MLKRLWRGGKNLYSVVRRAYSSLDVAYEDIKRTRDELRAADALVRDKRTLTDAEWRQVREAIADARSIMGRFLDAVAEAKRRVK